MFDIGFFELLVIATIGLVIIGPERLPDAVRTTARWWSRIKHSLASARSELEREIGADEIRREIHNDRVLRELRESRSELERDLNDTRQSIADGLAAKPADVRAPGAEGSQSKGHSTGAGEPTDPAYPEHLHEHGDPELNPGHPQHTAGGRVQRENNPPAGRPRGSAGNGKK